MSNDLGRYLLAIKLSTGKFVHFPLEESQLHYFKHYSECIGISIVCKAEEANIVSDGGWDKYFHKLIKFPCTKDEALDFIETGQFSPFLPPDDTTLDKWLEVLKCSQ